MNCPDAPYSQHGTISASGDQLSANGVRVNLNSGVHIPRPGFVYTGDPWVTGTFQLSGGGGGLMVYAPSSDLGDSSGNGLYIRANSVHAAIGNRVRVIANTTIGAISGGGGAILAKATNISKVLGANGVCVVADVIGSIESSNDLNVVKKTTGGRVAVGSITGSNRIILNDVDVGSISADTNISFLRNVTVGGNVDLRGSARTEFHNVLIIACLSEKRS